MKMVECMCVGVIVVCFACYEDNDDVLEWVSMCVNVEYFKVVKLPYGRICVWLILLVVSRIII